MSDKISLKRLIGILKNNRGISLNILGAFTIRGFGMLLGLFTMPLYMHYFSDEKILGVWFTILQVIGWALNFDLGVGNGLRNKLTVSLAHNDRKAAKAQISSAYILLGCITILIALVFYGISGIINWNEFLNIEDSRVHITVLRSCVNISMFGVLASFFLRLVGSIFYAMQLSSLNNLMTMLGNLLMVLYLFFVTPDESTLVNFRNLAIYHAIAPNAIYIIATVILFCSRKMKDCRPSLKSYSRIHAKGVLSLGVTFLVLQALWMIISVTNEWFITRFFSPEYTVDYSCYYRLYAALSTLYALALSPLWSAITKAQAEKRYSWMMKLQKALNFCVLAYFVIQLTIVPLTPWLFKIWLGSRAPEVNYLYCISFAFFNCVLVWSRNLATMCSGLGKLKSAMWCYIYAVIFKSALIIIISHYVQEWIIVVIVTTFAMLPFCFVQPIVVSKELKRLKLEIS